MPKKLLAWARAIVLGWAALLALAYGVEAPLLRWTGPLFGPPWFATAHLALDCATLAASGWIAGRMNRARALLTGIVLAATLSFCDFGGALALNVPWLLHLLLDSFRDSRYLDALASSAETHAVLFGCLLAGAALSRPREKPMSIGEPE